MSTATLPRIPFADVHLAPEDLDAVRRVLRTGWVAQRPRTKVAERRFAARVGTRHAVAVSSSSAALHLAYLAAGVGPSDEVIVSSLSPAAINAAIYCGARPVVADIAGQHDLSLDPVDVEQRITARTRAVAVSHLGGYPAQVRELAAICDRHGIALIEDAGHAPDTTIDGRRAGSFGLAGTFSFASNKVFATGEGGLLTTDSDAVARLARRRRMPTPPTTAWSRLVGVAERQPPGGAFDYRFDEPRAALLLARLERLDAELDRRRALVRRYREGLAGFGAITIPYRDVDVDACSCFAMPVMLREPDRRRAFQRRLLERHGVQTSLLRPASGQVAGDHVVWRPRTAHALATEVTLPLYPHLEERDQDRVIEAVEEALRA
jgi:dTDP-4-amino-4,6-dideoxygalactose transaminase